MGFAWAHNRFSCTSTWCEYCGGSWNTHPTPVAYYGTVERLDARTYGKTDASPHRWFNVFRAWREVLLLADQRCAGAPMLRRLLHVSLAAVRRAKRRRRLHALRRA